MMTPLERLAFKASTSMPVVKPYSRRVEPPPPKEEKSTATDASGSAQEVQPLPTAVPGPPRLPSNAVVLPYPPPVQLSVYQILPGPGAPAQTAGSPTVVSADGPQGPPGSLGPVPPPGPTGPNTPPTSTKSKTWPRTIHEYYDQHAFQWREFNPEDTVVGDETDSFIVYFRYASKSIGSRRQAFILPKHPQLIRIMQDCLPDYDWRTGEDMLVFPHEMVWRAHCRLNPKYCICDARRSSWRSRS